jgi:hypothetical protein
VTLRERRLIALGLLAATLALLWFAVGAPIRDGFREREAEREQALLSYQRNERVIAGQGVWRRALGAQRATAGAYAIEAATPALAADLLRDRVLGAARGAGAGAASAAEIPAPAGQVAVRSELQMTLGQLETMLRSLQNSTPPVLVQTLSVSSERAAASGRPDFVDVAVELSAPYTAGTAR